MRRDSRAQRRHLEAASRRGFLLPAFRVDRRRGSGHFHGYRTGHLRPARPDAPLDWKERIRKDFDPEMAECLEQEHDLATRELAKPWEDSEDDRVTESGVPARRITRYHHAGRTAGRRLAPRRLDRVGSAARNWRAKTEPHALRTSFQQDGEACGRVGHWRAHPQDHVSSGPLKFRTSGCPGYGFKHQAPRKFGAEPSAASSRSRPTQPYPRSDPAFAPPFDDAVHQVIVRLCVRTRRPSHRHLCPEVLAPDGLCCPVHHRLINLIRQ